MFKKLLAGLSVIALSLGIVALTAGPASAHTAQISHTCDAVSVTLSNYQNGGDNYVAIYIDDVKVVEDSDFGRNFTRVESFPDDGLSHSYRVVVVAHDGDQWSRDTGTVVVEPCPPDDTDRKIDICHKTGGPNYTENNISISAVLEPSGHGAHAQDIIPPFNYVKQGVSGSYPGQNWTPYNQLLHAAGCDKPTVVPAAPAFANAQCTDPGQWGDGSYTIPATAGVKYEVRFNGAGSYTEKGTGTYPAAVGTVVQIRAVELPGYELQGNDDNWRWSHTITAPDGNCIVNDASASVTVTQATCDAPGAPEFHIAYATWNSTPPTTPGTHTVTATADSGHAFPGGMLTKEIEYTVPDVLDSTVPGCEVRDARAAATPTQATCDEPGSVTFRIHNATWDAPADMTPGTHTRTATANPGHAFADGSLQKEFEYTIPDILDASQCIVPEPPKFYDAYCDDQVRGGVVDGYFVVYATDGVYFTWKLNGVDQGVVPAEAYGIPIAASIGDTVVIKAHAMDGYELKHPREARWMHEFTLDDLCTLPTVTVDVDSTQPTCDADGSLTFETLDGDLFPDAVSWTVGGLPATEGSYAISGTQTVVLTATAAEGYGFAGEEGATLEWELDFTDPRPCDDLPTLALTGTDSSVLSGLGFGGVVLLAGGLLVLARQRRALIRP